MLPGLPTDAVPSADEALWRLTHGPRTAVCWLRQHALGYEVRVDVNGDTMRTTVEPTRDDANAQAAYMREAMIKKGWSDGVDS